MQLHYNGMVFEGTAQELGEVSKSLTGTKRTNQPLEVTSDKKCVICQRNIPSNMKKLCGGITCRRRYAADWQKAYARKHPRVYKNENEVKTLANGTAPGMPNPFAQNG